MGGGGEGGAAGGWFRNIGLGSSNLEHGEDDVRPHVCVPLIDLVRDRLQRRETFNLNKRRLSNNQ